MSDPPDVPPLDPLVALRSEVERQSRQARRSKRIAAVALTVSVIVGGGWYLNRTEPWAPIGKLPDQIIHAPHVTVNGFVEVTGTKCFNELPVKIAGVQWWQSDTNSAIIVEVGRGERTFDPKHPIKGVDHWHGKCDTTNFRNPVDPKIVEWARRGVTAWHIAGSMTPERESGNGTVRTWRTGQIIVSAIEQVLGPYEEQQVVGINSDVVTINGVLCATRTVDVVTTISFQAFHKPYRYPSDSIAGAIVPLGTFNQTRTKGCATFAGRTAFKNTITANVRALDKAIQVDHQWRVVGDETAPGVDPASFYSTSFPIGG